MPDLTAELRNTAGETLYAGHDYFGDHIKIWRTRIAIPERGVFPVIKVERRGGHRIILLHSIPDAVEAGFVRRSMKKLRLPSETNSTRVKT